MNKVASRPEIREDHCDGCCYGDVATSCKHPDADGQQFTSQRCESIIWIEDTPEGRDNYAVRKAAWVLGRKEFDDE